MLNQYSCKGEKHESDYPHNKLMLRIFTLYGGIDYVLLLLLLWSPWPRYTRYVSVLDASCSVACCWLAPRSVCTINRLCVLRELHSLLTSTGFGPRSGIVRILGKSAMISEAVCVALCALNKDSLSTGYGCIRLLVRSPRDNPYRWTIIICNHWKWKSRMLRTLEVYSVLIHCV